MTLPLATRFDSIEEAQEYVGLLREVVDETRALVARDLSESPTATSARRVDALRLVDYKLLQLGEHLRAGTRLLNDLRMLRRMLSGERGTITRPDESKHVRAIR